MWSDAVPIQLRPSPVSHEVAACRRSFRLVGLAALQFRTFLFGRAAKRGYPVLRTGPLIPSSTDDDDNDNDHDHDHAHDLCDRRL